jgi:hypothetical protein
MDASVKEAATKRCLEVQHQGECMSVHGQAARRDSRACPGPSMPTPVPAVREKSCPTLMLCVPLRIRGEDRRTPAQHRVHHRPGRPARRDPPRGCARCGGGSCVARARGSAGGSSPICPQERIADGRLPARAASSPMASSAAPPGPGSGFDIKPASTPAMVRSPRSGRTTADRGATGNRHE